jgi:hypothetical protein
MAFKMNKKRNAGLVYEFLVRRLGVQLVDRDRDGACKTVEITEKYFGTGKPLTSELELFRAIRDTRGVSQEVARRVLGEVARQARSIDQQTSATFDIKKSNLIKELNHTFGKEFFDRHRLPEYRLFGAIQLFVDGMRGGRLSENVEALQLEDGLVRWMTSVPAEPKDLDCQVDELVCTMASRRFGEKYGNALNSGQRSLLETYVRALVTEDSLPLQKKLGEDRDRIARVLVESFSLKEIQGDPVMKRRYVEAAKKLAAADMSRTDDSLIEEMMLYWKLSEELQSNE